MLARLSSLFLEAGVMQSAPGFDPYILSQGNRVAFVFLPDKPDFTPNIAYFYQYYISNLFLKVFMTFFNSTLFESTPELLEGNLQIIACAGSGKTEFVTEEIRFPTSYSELAYYLNCKYDYKMRFIYGFNPKLVPALGFGKQVHNVINLLHKDFEGTGKIPTKAKIAQVIEEHFYLRYASDSVSERLKVGAMKSLTKYVQMWEKDFSLSVKTERPFELEFDNALIAGSIDMIKREDGNETVL